MHYSPKLRRIADQIRPILEKEKVTCLMLLHDENTQHIEYLQILDIPENLVHIRDGKMRITTKGIIGKKTKERRLKNTVNMVFNMMDRVTQWFLMLRDIKTKLERDMQVDVFRGGEFPKGHDDN